MRVLGAGSGPPHLAAGWFPSQLLQMCKCLYCGNVHPDEFHFLHASPDGRNTRGLTGTGTGLVGFDIAITADSRLFSLSPKPGSGLPLIEQSLSLCDVAKQSSHRRVPADFPEKFIVNDVPFMTDHFLFPERAALRLNAESYQTQPNPSSSCNTQTIVPIYAISSGTGRGSTGATSATYIPKHWTHVNMSVTCLACLVRPLVASLSSSRGCPTQNSGSSSPISTNSHLLTYAASLPGTGGMHMQPQPGPSRLDLPLSAGRSAPSWSSPHLSHPGPMSLQYSGAPPRLLPGVSCPMESRMCYQGPFGPSCQDMYD